MRRLFGLLCATVLLVGLSAPAGATVVAWSGLLELELGAQGTAPGLLLPVPGGGTAIVNGSGMWSPATTGITVLQLPAGAFATSVSVPVYNQAPIVNLALVAANAPITVAKGQPCSNFGHSAVGRGGMFLPTGTGAGSHGIFCFDGPFAMYGTGGLVGNAFVGLFGTVGSPFANLTVPLTVIGAGSTVLAPSPLGVTVAAAGMGWLTGAGAVRYVSTTPGGNATFTTTLVSTGIPQIQAGPNTALVKLVSPVSIQIAGVGALPLPSFARITLLIPEAGSLVLLGTGIAGLAIYGHRRRRN